MKKIQNLVLGGIQQKVFNLVLFTIILIVAAYSGMFLYQSKTLTELTEKTNKEQREAIAAISGQTMDAVMDNNMVSITRIQAMLADDLFKELKFSTEFIGDYAKMLFDNPELYAAVEVAPPNPSRNGITAAQLLLEKGTDPEDPEIAQKIGLIGNLSGLMCSLFDKLQMNSCFAALPEGVFMIVDNQPQSKLSRNGSVYTFTARERYWYEDAVKKGDLVFSDAHYDAFTGRTEITCSLPVYHEGELAAVVGAGFYLTSENADFLESRTEGAFYCVLNNQGQVIFSPAEKGLFHVNVSSKAEDLRENENPELAAFIRQAMKEHTDVTLVNTEEGAFYMCSSPLEAVEWTLISVVGKDIIDQPTIMMNEQQEQIQKSAIDTFRNTQFHLTNIIRLIIILISLMGIGSGMYLSRKIIDPINTITKRVASLGVRNARFMMEDVYRTGDEIEVLADAFAKVSDRTIRYMDKIKAVTAEKERIGAELDMARKIQVSQVPRLFPAFPTRREFDLYASMSPAKEVGGDFYDFFLIDDDHICLVMADVSGKGVPAALFMMVSRVLIKTHLQGGQSPSEALYSVNNQLCESNEANFFVTVWLAVVQISTGKGIAVNAGHEHPVLRRAGGQYELVVYRHSPAVAIMEEILFKEHEFEMYPGDSLFVYTDGVAEATNAEEELYGTERMLDALNQNPDADPKTTLGNVLDGINAFVAEAEQFDDITMLSMKYFGPQSDQKKSDSD